MSMQRGLLLCCWLGLAACSSETTDSDESVSVEEIEAISTDETEERPESAPAGGGESPIATVTVDGETYEVRGNGSCKLIGSRRLDDPDGVLDIQVRTPDNDMYVQVRRSPELGLLVAFHKTEAPLGSWSDGFAPADDPSQFDGRRFTFEGDVVWDPAQLSRTTMRMEIDCPFVEDVTTD